MEEVGFVSVNFAMLCPKLIGVALLLRVYMALLADIQHRNSSVLNKMEKHNMGEPGDDKSLSIGHDPEPEPEPEPSKRYNDTFGKDASSAQGKNMVNDNQIAIIDWMKSDTCNIKLKFVSQGTVQSKINKYIDMTLSKHMVKDLSLRNMWINLFYHIYFDIFCHDVTLFSYTNDLITLPCGIIYYNTWESMTQQKWRLTVYEHFMVNVTIMQGFVPYTRHCRPHHFTVHEGLRTSRTSTVDTFCGKVQYESVYTKSNEAAIVFTARVSVTPFNVFLWAKYSVFIKHQAYKFMGKCSHDGITSAIKPSVLLFISAKLYYYWYIYRIRCIIISRNTL